MMTDLSADFRLMRKLFGVKGALPFNFSVFGSPWAPWGHSSALSTAPVGLCTTGKASHRSLILPLVVTNCSDRKSPAYLGWFNWSSFVVGEKNALGRNNSRGNSFKNHGIDQIRLHKSRQLRNFGDSSAVLASIGGSVHARKPGQRPYSTDNHNREGGNEQRAEMKGVVVHIPHPIEWLKNLWYLFIVQGWLDSSFSRQEFLYGAKQALCHLTRLAVLKDFDSMKLVASAEVVGKMKEIVSSLSLEQLQSIEILPENINLAKFNVSSVSYQAEGSFAVAIDVFCLAIRMFRSQPLLIQMIIRFNRNYEHDHQSDWRIASIQEFNIREMVVSKDEGSGNPK